MSDIRQSSTIASSPAELRQYFRQQRRQLSADQQQDAASQLVERVARLNAFQQARRVALYLPNDGELDPTPLIQHCWSENKTVHLPVLHPFAKGHLVFVQYCPKTVMRPNRFGIPEPAVECHRLCPSAELDLIFTPLVAFDDNGNRLGMGGGFYDRTLKPVFESASSELIGLAHDCQQASSLPIQPWDIPLQKIITPTRVIAG